MEGIKGKPRMSSVPQFGGWDGKSKDETNYSVVFSEARANRKKHKSEVTMTSQSLGDEREFLRKHHQHNNSNDGYSPVLKSKKEKKKTVTCFSCFFRS